MDKVEKIQEDNQIVLRPRKITVLAYGEGEAEKIFLRYLVSCYCRRYKVSVATSSAGGGDPTSILDSAIRFRRGVKRDFEFILLDTDKPWSDEMKRRAREEGIKLIGSHPCLEAFFLKILESPDLLQGVGSGRCKASFKKLCESNNFNDEVCAKLFPKSLLKSARQRLSKLDEIIKIIEGEFEGIDTSSVID